MGMREEIKGEMREGISKEIKGKPTRDSDVESVASSRSAAIETSRTTSFRSTVPVVKVADLLSKISSLENRLETRLEPKSEDIPTPNDSHINPVQSSIPNIIPPQIEQGSENKSMMIGTPMPEIKPVRPSNGFGIKNTLPIQSKKHGGVEPVTRYTHPIVPIKPS